MMAAQAGSAATTAREDLDAVAGTARWTAAMRARESSRADRLFTDPWADMLAGEQGRALLEVLGDNATIPVRTRFFDEALGDLAARGRCGQLVLVAAGMDTRAYRLGLPAGTRVFELDRPELLALKDTLLADAPRPSCTRRAVGVDLAGDWSAALPAAGFDPDRPAMWLVEGVLQYLEALAVTGLLDGITASSAAGSHLLVGFVGQSLLDHSGMQDWLAELAERGMTWRYGTDEPEELLAPRGWHTEVNMLSAVGTRLGRWPFPDAPRGTPGVPHGYLVHAHR